MGREERLEGAVQEGWRRQGEQAERPGCLHGDDENRRGGMLQGGEMCVLERGGSSSSLETPCLD